MASSFGLAALRPSRRFACTRQFLLLIIIALICACGLALFGVHQGRLEDTHAHAMTTAPGTARGSWLNTRASDSLAHAEVQATIPTHYSNVPPSTLASALHTGWNPTSIASNPIKVPRQVHLDRKFDLAAQAAHRRGATVPSIVATSVTDVASTRSSFSSLSQSASDGRRIRQRTSDMKHSASSRLAGDRSTSPSTSSASNLHSRYLGSHLSLQCEGRGQMTLADFTQRNAPAWLNRTTHSASDPAQSCQKSFAACMWYHCADYCQEDATDRGTISVKSGRGSKSGGGSGGSGGRRGNPHAHLPPSTLPKHLSRFDASGAVTVAAPTGGSMLVDVGNGESRPLRLAPSAHDRSHSLSSSSTLDASASGSRGTSGPSASSRRSFAPVDVIATLTSLPSRLRDVKATIESLKAQTFPVKAIVVAVPRDDGLKHGGRAGEAKAYAVPSWLLEDPSVCVLRTPLDWGPATKLVGLSQHLWQQGIGGKSSDWKGHETTGRRSNQAARNASALSSRARNGDSHSELAQDMAGVNKLRLLVVDDDTWYPPRTVEALMKWSLRLPRAAIGQHGWVTSPQLVYAGSNSKDQPLHFWGRHCTEPRPVSVLTGNTAYLVQPRHLDPLFWQGLEPQRPGESKGGKEAWRLASTGAKYMDDVWISGHLSRRGVPRFAVPMDTAEPRAKWTGGDGPTLESVNGQNRRQMNDAALQSFQGLWDVVRCASPATAKSSAEAPPSDETSSAAEPGACAGPVALWHKSLRESSDDGPRGLSLEGAIQEE